LRKSFENYLVYMNNYFDCGRYRLPMQGTEFKPLVMGILNATPDSFSDGGQFQYLDAAISHAEQMIAAGVDIIDIGGESSRPGAQVLPLDEELKRVLPVVFALRDCGVPLSVDTYKPEVMREVIAAGADMINDIQGFRSQASLDAVAQSEVGICIMHMQNTPADMQAHPEYVDVCAEVSDYLGSQLQRALESGIHKNRICIDPGFGFGKKLDHNVALAKDISAMQARLGFPVLAGFSRKSMLGAITERVVEQRMPASIGAAIAAVANGAKIVRVHDVAETVDALKVWATLSA
jgi:dihydropteroate synthase